MRVYIEVTMKKSDTPNSNINNASSDAAAAQPSQQQQPQQQQQALPSAGEIKGRWKQHIGAAKIAWGKLTEDELRKAEGHEQKLAGLIQERYAVSREEAEKQVKAFYEKNKLN
jgi:uncharacterized protein YjbJ (UPF0337 family)